MFRSPCPRLLRSSIVALAAWCAFGAIDAGAQDEKPRAATGPVQPFFEAHCQKCHGGDKHKGDFRIESLTDNFADRQTREKWLTVMEQLEAGDMPPKKEGRPPAEKVAAAVGWVRSDHPAGRIP